VLFGVGLKEIQLDFKHVFVFNSYMNTEMDKL